MKAAAILVRSLWCGAAHMKVMGLVLLQYSIRQPINSERTKLIFTHNPILEKKKNGISPTSISDRSAFPHPPFAVAAIAYIADSPVTVALVTLAI